MHIYFLQVLDGLKIGNEALKKANEMFSIEEIEQIMEDTAEAIDKQKEIDALLSGQLTDQDEDEVEAELEQLIEASEEPVVLPEVPLQGKIQSSIDDIGHKLTSFDSVCFSGKMHQRKACCVPWV